MKVLLSGANGYLGSLIVKYLNQQGFECIRLVRNPVAASDRKFALGDEVSQEIFRDIEVFIHAAHDFTALGWKETCQTNVVGAAKLFAFAKESRLKAVIFISSMSSFSGCKSNYGRAKLAIEKQVLALTNGYVVRPGLIYGSAQGGMVQALAKLAKLPILPAFKTSAPLYFCHYQDLLELIRQITVGDVLPQATPIVAASPEPYTFYQVLKKMGAKTLIPFPWQPLWLVLKIFELCGARPRTGSDNLVSLINQNPNPDFSGQQQLKLHWRSFNGVNS